MGNFKPRTVARATTTNKKIQDFYVPFTAPDGKERYMITDDDAILHALYVENYELAQNMLNTGKACWLETPGGDKPNVRHSTLLRFKSKNFIEETRKDIPVAFYSLSRLGLKYCEKTFGSIAPKVHEPLVKTILHQEDHPTSPEPKQHEDKLRVEDCTVFLNKLPDQSTIITIHTSNPLVVAKLKAILSIKKDEAPVIPRENETAAPLKIKGRKKWGAQFIKGYRNCHYCKKAIPFYKTNKNPPFRVKCHDPKCVTKYQADVQLRKQLREEGADVSNL